MAQPQKYEREADFTKNHGSIQNDSLLNSELDDIALTVNGLRERQALILKDDDSVKNGIFGIDQLTSELRASLDKTIIDTDDALKFAKKADEQSNNALQASAEAVSTANQANTKSDTAISTANSAKNESENALSISQSASETANTAKATAESVVEQYNTAINTANEAVATAGQATNNANTALETANTAITTANTARTTATNAQTIASNYAAEIINYENRIDATVANIPTEVNYAVNAKNIPGLIATEVQNALQNVEVAGLTYDTIVGALGFTPADNVDLTAEESARSSADATLQANITAETTARTSAISAEATARQNADNALQTKIDNIGDNLATVAKSGSYNDLTDVPTNVSAFTNDAQYLTPNSTLDASKLNVSYLPTSGGTVNGDVIVNGNITSRRSNATTFLQSICNDIERGNPPTDANQYPVGYVLKDKNARNVTGIYTEFYKNGALTSSLISYSGIDVGYTFKKLGITCSSTGVFKPVYDDKELLTVETGLPLSGGTMSGQVTSKFNGAFIKQGTDNSMVGILGGTSSSGGCGALWLYGKASTEHQAGWVLRSSNGTNVSTLEGKPDGSLAMSGKNILREDTLCTTKPTTTSTASASNPAVVVENYYDSATGDWYSVRSDGWVEQGGYIDGTGKIGANENGQNPISFHVAFTNTKYFFDATPDVEDKHRDAIVTTKDREVGSIVCNIYDPSHASTTSSVAWYACGY